MVCIGGSYYYHDTYQGMPGSWSTKLTLINVLMIVLKHEQVDLRNQSAHVGYEKPTDNLKDYSIIMLLIFTIQHQHAGSLTVCGSYVSLLCALLAFTTTVARVCLCMCICNLTCYLTCWYSLLYITCTLHMNIE